MGIRGNVTRTNLAYANEHRDWQVFADIAMVLNLVAIVPGHQEQHGVVASTVVGTAVDRTQESRDLLPRPSLGQAFLPVTSGRIDLFVERTTKVPLGVFPLQVRPHVGHDLLKTEAGVVFSRQTDEVLDSLKAKIPHGGRALIGLEKLQEEAKLLLVALYGGRREAADLFQISGKGIALTLGEGTFMRMNDADLPVLG